jgi:hypothetical protein
MPTCTTHGEFQYVLVFFASRNTIGETFETWSISIMEADCRSSMKLPVECRPRWSKIHGFFYRKRLLRFTYVSFPRLFGNLRMTREHVFQIVKSRSLSHRHVLNRMLGNLLFRIQIATFMLAVRWLFANHDHLYTFAGTSWHWYTKYDTLYCSCRSIANRNGWPRHFSCPNF